MIYGILHEHVVVAHMSLLLLPSPTRHCYRCHCPHITVTAAVAHASPSPPPSPACRCCRCHRCRHHHLCINIAEEGPCYCPNTWLRCRKACCVAQSQHMSQTKKKRKDLLLGPTSGSQGQERRPPLRPTRYLPTHVVCRWTCHWCWRRSRTWRSRPPRSPL